MAKQEEVKTAAPARQSPKEEKPGSPPSAQPPLPMMIDFSLSVGKLMVLLVGVMTAIVSLLAGATLPMTVLRSGSAILSVGLCVWAFNWLLSRNSLEIARQELQREVEAARAREQDHTASTVEIEA